MYGQLKEVQSSRVAIDAYRKHEIEALAQYEKDKAYWAERIAAEQQTAMLAAQGIVLKQKELDLMTEKKDFYEAAYNVCKANKKKGFWCKMKKVFTLGMTACK